MFTDFEYADKRLSDFGWVVGHIDDTSGVIEVDVGCDIVFNTVKNNHSSIHYVTSTSYENVCTPPSFDIFKSPCGKNQEDMYVFNDEVSLLVKWLNRHDYRKFKPLYHSDNSDVHYYGSFNIKKKIVNDRVIGLVLTFNSNAPYGFGDNVNLEYEIFSENENIQIHGNSDELDVIYPHMTITLKEDGDLKIANVTTGKFTEIKNCVSGETIYINGEHKFIDSDNEEHKTTTLFNDFNYEYLSLHVEDDDYSENIFEVSLPCVITIGYYPIRKVGV